MSRPRFPRSAERLVVMAVCVAAACSKDSSLGPVISTTRTITVDASAGYVYLALDTIAQVVPVTNASTSSAWDIGFFATGVSLNGGAAGPGGVSGFCLCEHETATTADIQAMTPANQLAVFDSVDASASPAATAYGSDALDPVINGWYSGSGASASVTAGRTWIIRKTAGAVVLAKFQIAGLIGPSATTPGKVVFQYAIEPSAGAAFGAVKTDTVTVSAGTWTYFDLAANAVGTSASWDVAFDGWNVRTNGGVSGSGGVMGLVDATTPFANIDYTYASGAPPQAYRSDSFSGIFAAHPWYRYNITGTDNQIWPVYNVYLIRRGSAVFKVQLIGYYSTIGAPRNITIRYARIAG